jgi:hypothetical protein
MNVSAAGLTADSVGAYLRKRGVDEETTAAVRYVVGACDAARFAAGSSSVDRGMKIAGQAEDVLRKLEKRYLG